jgi:hypothetical protein
VDGLNGTGNPLAVCLVAGVTEHETLPFFEYLKIPLPPKKDRFSKVKVT